MRPAGVLARAAPLVTTPRHHLDARRLLCPMPVIRTQERVAGLAPGDVLEVSCTDPGARSDIPTWCRINGHRLLGIEERDDVIHIFLEVGGGPGAGR